MKILVVNLLRIGDVIMSTSIINGLQKKYKDAEVDLLINEECKAIGPLLGNLNSLKLFPRKKLQDKIGVYGNHIFEASDYLESFIEELKSEDYDLVVNLTQNKISAWLVGALGVKQTHGLHFNELGQASYGTSWFRYLNDYVTAGGRDSFHYIDIFYYGSELNSERHEIQLLETEAGRKEADGLINPEDKIICVQPFTSDEKKNWEEEKLIECLNYVKAQYGDYNIYILGAPFEAEKIEELILAASEKGLELRPALCSLEGAYSILQKADLLLTMDTSIKHIASATDCKIVELCFGSSDFKKTGVYKEECIIVESNEYCSPCVHSKDCHRSERYCAQRVEALPVATLISKYLENDYIGLKTIAREYSDQIKIYRTMFTHSGYWSTRNLLYDFSSHFLKDEVGKSSQKLYLMGAHKKVIGEYGSESIKVKALINQSFPNLNNKKILEAIDGLERDCTNDSDMANKLTSDFRTMVRSSQAVALENIKFSLKGMAFKADLPLFNEIINESNLDSFKSLKEVRVIEEELKGFQKKTEIKMKIVRTLKAQLMEIL